VLNIRVLLLRNIISFKKTSYIFAFPSPVNYLAMTFSVTSFAMSSKIASIEEAMK
jgi:hypothetical protein